MTSPHAIPKIMRNDSIYRKISPSTPKAKLIPMRKIRQQMIPHIMPNITIKCQIHHPDPFIKLDHLRPRRNLKLRPSLQFTLTLLPIDALGPIRDIGGEHGVNADVSAFVSDFRFVFVGSVPAAGVVEGGGAGDAVAGVVVVVIAVGEGGVVGGDEVDEAAEGGGEVVLSEADIEELMECGGNLEVGVVGMGVVKERVGSGGVEKG
mmetsp:Transcript_24115/g.49330  ORF Transcript_24115/g.49330 Transcript_24115/m.49330 type:complete len:206 (-) Transcript_24115:245-862(-)